MRNYIGTARFSTVQSVAYTGTAGTIASGIGLGCTTVRVCATTDCYIAVGKTPTATTSDVLLPGLAAEYITINPGEKVSAIQLASGGILNVVEVA